MAMAPFSRRWPLPRAAPIRNTWPWATSTVTGCSTSRWPVPVSIPLGSCSGPAMAPSKRRSSSRQAEPRSTAVGDFNRDGVPDLAGAHSASNDISVLLGTGDGSFQTARSFAAGSGPLYMAMGDVNGDGRPDLAVTNFDSNLLGPNTVSVLLGNGDGTFRGATAFGAGADPVSVAIGDVNGDGRPDLMVANFISNNVSVLINNTAFAPTTFTLTVTTTGTGSGTVTSSPQGIDCGTTCVASYDSGTVVTLTATP